MSKLQFSDDFSNKHGVRPPVKPMPLHSSPINRPSSSYRRVQRGSAPMTRRDFTRGMLAAAAGLTITAIGGGLWFTNRAVACEINGVQQEVTWRSSIKDIVKEGIVSPTYGNLLSVSNKLLKEGEGNRYTVTVNGADLGDEIDNYRVSDGDVIVFSNGTDKMEDADVTKTPVPFNIVKDGTAGAIGYISQWGKEGYAEKAVGKISGESVDRGVVSKAQDTVVSYLNIKPANGEKLAAITFDDGPSEYSLQIIDVLAKYNAKGTFFDIGNNVHAHANIVQQVKDAGHQVACHSMTHPAFTASTADTIHSEITNSTAELHNAGVDTRFFRAPYGAFKLREWGILQDGITALIGWNIDTLDWKKPGVDTIVHNATEVMKPGAIILCHAGGGNREQTVEALPHILDAWTQAGYSFVTVADLIKSDGRFPSEVTGDCVHKPDDAQGNPANVDDKPTSTGDDVKGTAGMG